MTWRRDSGLPDDRSFAIVRRSIASRYSAAKAMLCRLGQSSSTPVRSMSAGRSTRCGCSASRPTPWKSCRRSASVSPMVAQALRRVRTWRSNCSATRRPSLRSPSSRSIKMPAPATIAVTIGEPAGIGPDLAVRLVERTWPARLVLVGDMELIRERARRLGAGIRLVPYTKRGVIPSAIEVAHFPLAVPVQAGRLNPANAKSVLSALDAAIGGCLSGEFAAMVTAPVQKSVINDAGIPFTGHTEFLAERTGTPHVVMLLVGKTAVGQLRVGLATTHLPLAQVPSAITRESLATTLRIIAADLRAKFGIDNPRIGVCGLNPHAGE